MKEKKAKISGIDLINSAVRLKNQEFLNKAVGGFVDDLEKTYGTNTQDGFLQTITFPVAALLAKSKFGAPFAAELLVGSFVNVEKERQKVIILEKMQEYLQPREETTYLHAVLSALRFAPINSESEKTAGNMLTDELGKLPRAESILLAYYQIGKNDKATPFIRNLSADGINRIAPELKNKKDTVKAYLCSAEISPEGSHHRLFSAKKICSLVNDFDLPDASDLLNRMLDRAGGDLEITGMIEKKFGIVRKNALPVRIMKFKKPALSL